VKTMAGNTITLAQDAGPEMSVVVQDSTRLLRTAPGQKDLKGATAMELKDLQIGDRMFARGSLAADGKSLLAASIIVMTKGDVAARQEQEREDWQKRGTGGLVKSVDAAAGTISLTVSATGASKTVTVHISKDTVIRRYAPDSVKFDDAKPGTLEQIKTGDQLRARGDHSADGNEVTAQEIVSGTFRNIAGTIASVDAANSTVNVMDLITKKAVTLKITPDSQVRKLPEPFARRIAVRLKGEPPAGTAGGQSAAGAPNSGASNGGQAGPSGGAGFAKAGEAGPGNGGGFRGDFQQMLSRMPGVGLTDLQKGDSVMIVATEGSGNAQPTAITLLTGVEAILSAASSSQAAMLLSPWNLGGGGDAGANP